MHYQAWIPYIPVGVFLIPSESLLLRLRLRLVRSTKQAADLRREAEQIRSYQTNRTSLQSVLIAMLVLRIFIFTPYSTMDGETFRRYLKSKDIIIFIVYSDRY